MTIARTVIEESKKHDIPVSLFLAIMKKESNFNVHARSPVNAMGIMQIHPVTWDAYTKKLNLDVSRKNAFDPALNIMVSAALLNDLRDQYLKKGYEETILWDYILSSYYAGGESLKDGLKRNHRYYVKKVREYERGNKQHHLMVDFQVMTPSLVLTYKCDLHMLSNVIRTIFFNQKIKVSILNAGFIYRYRLAV